MRLFDDWTGEYGVRRGATRAGVFGLLAAILATFAVCVVALLWSGVAQAAFPRTNGQIAYVRPNADYTTYLWRARADGSSPRRLSSTAQSDTPAWSADGKKIVFTTVRDPSDPNYEDIWSANADGSGRIRLTNDREQKGDPAWFPSGRKIVFVKKEPTVDPSTGAYNLYTLTLGANGGPAGEPVRITNSTSVSEYNMFPVISPDGTSIAFASNRDGDYEIYVMKAEPESATNLPRPLTANQTTDDYAPDWSPDGGKLVFERSQAPTNSGTDIWRMNADGSQQVRLTNRPDGMTTSPVWSPDGKKIAFQRFVISKNVGNFDIFSMRPVPESRTNRAVNLTRTPVEEESSPSWQPLP